MTKGRRKRKGRRFIGLNSILRLDLTEKVRLLMAFVLYYWALFLCYILLYMNIMSLTSGVRGLNCCSEQIMKQQ